jgi:hypothetical protein
VFRGTGRKLILVSGIYNLITYQADALEKAIHTPDGFRARRQQKA